MGRMVVFLVVYHKGSHLCSNTILSVASAASEDTPGVGTGHACQALDGCLQPEGFDSAVLRADVQPK